MVMKINCVSNETNELSNGATYITNAGHENVPESDIIIESTSASDNEDSDSYSDSNSNHETQITNVSNPLSLINSTPAFGNVAITNSEGVHIGNKTYFTGSVTIKQFVQSKDGIINNAFSETETEDFKKNATATPKRDNSPLQSSCDRFFTGVDLSILQKILVLTLGLISFGAVCAVIIVLMGKSYSSNISIPPPNLIEEDPLLSGPHLRLVSRTDWLAQPIEQPLDKLERPVPWVIITHTATESCESQSECVLRVRLIQMYHIESRNWSDIGYNFLVGGDGSAYYGRGWDYVGAHTKGYNTRSIGIAFLGTFNKIEPPKIQLDACRKLIDLGVREGKIAKNYKLLGHRQLMSTLSPGDRLYAIIREWPHFAKNFTDVSEIMN